MKGNNLFFPWVAEQRRQAAELAYVKSKNDALERSQAIIEFTLDGHIEWANDNFLRTMGYTLAEIRGQHHKLFVASEYRNSAEYREFWDKLGKGEYHSGEYKRFKKDGQLIWLQATYSPILDAGSRPIRIIKTATDITTNKEQSLQNASKIDAIIRSQAVIEFTLDGHIEWANDNFLKVMGFQLDEIKGQHHRLFVEPGFASSDTYQLFWDRLRRGEFHSGEFDRIAKGGRRIRLQAIYNPILGLSGKPIKIVKFASDITTQYEAQKQTNKSITEIIEMVIASASSDVYSVTDTLVTVTKNQLNQSQEIASAIEEMVSTIANTAQNTTLASNTAEKNGSIARNGAKVVTKTIENIKYIAELVTETSVVVKRLGTSSEQIGDIVQVIDDIADQTNLLALNAAIEAARAGNHGKGFAVVADEVRKLAERTSKATYEISGMIQSIQREASEAVEAMLEGQKEVELGLELADQAGAALEDIVKGSVDTIDVITHIASASEEQSATSEEIAQAVDQIAIGARDSASAVNQISEAAGELRELTSQIRTQIEKLKSSNAFFEKVNA